MVSKTLTLICGWGIHTYSASHTSPLMSGRPGGLFPFRNELSARQASKGDQPPTFVVRGHRGGARLALRHRLHRREPVRGSTPHDRLGLLDGRYLAAGIHYAVSTFLPIFGAFHFHKSIRRRAWPEILLWFNLATLLPIGLFLLVATGSERHPTVDYVGYVLLLVGMTILIAAKRNGGPVQQALRGSGVWYAGLMPPSLLAVATATMFGMSVYPGISPAYGGGGAWLASVYLSPAAPGQLMIAVSDSVVVLNRDADTIYALSCAFVMGQPRLVAVEIPRRLADGMRTHRPMSALQYTHDLADQSCVGRPDPVDPSRP